MSNFEKIIDLSQPLYHNCPGWPTSALTEVNYEAIAGKDGYTVENLKISVHTGTHLDAPFHFFPDGKTIDEIPVGEFQGEAVLVNLFGIEADTGISVDHLIKYENKIQKGDIVILYTGWGQKRNITREYYYQWPYLTKEGAEWLLEKGVKGVGIDGLSIGGWGPDKGPQPHTVLLKNNIWLLEELLIDEELLKHERFYLTAFPLKLRRFGGSPTRAVAFI